MELPLELVQVLHDGRMLLLHDVIWRCDRRKKVKLRDFLASNFQKPIENSLSFSDVSLHQTLEGKIVFPSSPSFFLSSYDLKQRLDLCKIDWTHFDLLKLSDSFRYLNLKENNLKHYITQRSRIKYNLLRCFPKLLTEKRVGMPQLGNSILREANHEFHRMQNINNWLMELRETFVLAGNDICGVSFDSEVSWA
jgi:hypothetical protein